MLLRYDYKARNNYLRLIIIYGKYHQEHICVYFAQPALKNMIINFDYILQMQVNYLAQINNSRKSGMKFIIDL